MVVKSIFNQCKGRYRKKYFLGLLDFSLSWSSSRSSELNYSRKCISALFSMYTTTCCYCWKCSIDKSITKVYPNIFMLELQCWSFSYFMLYNLTLDHTFKLMMIQFYVGWGAATLPKNSAASSTSLKADRCYKKKRAKSIFLCGKNISTLFFLSMNFFFHSSRLLLPPRPFFIKCYWKRKRRVSSSNEGNLCVVQYLVYNMGEIILNNIFLLRVALRKFQFDEMLLLWWVLAASRQKRAVLRWG